MSSSYRILFCLGLVACIQTGCGRGDDIDDKDERNVKRRGVERPDPENDLPRGVVRRHAHRLGGKGAFDFSYSANEQFLALVHEDEVAVWKVNEKARPRSFPVRRVVSHALSPDGKAIVISDRDKGAVAWDTCWETRLFTVRSPEAGKLNEMSSRVSFSPDGRLLINRIDNQVRFYDWALRKEILPWRIVTKTGDGGVYAFCITPDSNYLLLLMSIFGAELNPSQYFCRAVDLKTGQFAWQFALPVRGLLESCHLSADGRLLLLTTHIRRDDIEKLKNPEDLLDRYWTYSLWEIASGKRVLLKDRVEDFQQGDILAQDGRFFIFPGRNEGFFSTDMWDLQRNELMGQLKLPDEYAPWGTVRLLKDGKTAAVSHSDDKEHCVYHWDLSPALKPLPKLKLAPQELEQYWADLAAEDAVKARKAVYDLAASPETAVAFFKPRLKAIEAVDDKTLEALIADLDAPRLPARQTARAKLELLGGFAAAALHKALAKPAPLAQAREIEQVLKASLPPYLSTERLRRLRAVEVLERLGTAEARQLLQTVAAGAAGAPETEAARGAVARLAKQ